MNVIQSPGSLSKMLAERSSEILRRKKRETRQSSRFGRINPSRSSKTHVVANDRNERSHPSLKTTVDERSVVGNRVRSVSACLKSREKRVSRVETNTSPSLLPRLHHSNEEKSALTSSIPLLFISPKQHHVQIHQIQTLERLVRSAQANLIQIRGQPSHAGREHHDRTRREDVWDDDLGEGSLVVFSYVLGGERDVDEGGGESFESGGGFGFGVGVDFEGGSEDVFGLGSGELDGVDWNERRKERLVEAEERRTDGRKGEEDATTHCVLEKRDLPC